jgi:hypothetical protein
MYPHQALLAGPEYTSKRTTRNSYRKFHIVKKTEVSGTVLIPPWAYESTVVKDLLSDSRLVALVCVGKIMVPVEDLDYLLAQVPICQPDDTDQEKARRFKDTTWVASAFNFLSNKGLISHAATLASSMDLECRSQAFIQAYGGCGSNPQDGKEIPVLDLMYSKAKNECTEYD